MIKQLSNKDLGRISPQEFRLTEKIPLVVVLDGIRSMHNVGSVFRTCDAFCVERLVLCGITPTPPHREIQKTALGATETVLWEYEADITEIIKRFKAEGRIVYALEQTNQSILLNEMTINPDEKAVLILGNEVFGVSQEVLDLVDAAIEIRMTGSKHSLNVSVAAGIGIYKFFEATIGL
ncbi:MAG: RNA methyltransferase [Bacteroidales bacterium]|jgi:tRNA G18 (ribose-2'-O)-methylase SpoU|nr:RNA methyltransferase [Bacteroidales bacterium]